MSTKLLFLIQIGAVVGVLLFHLLAARQLIRHLPIRSKTERTWLRIAAGIMIAMLDLPLVHQFVLYKFYNPLVLDQLMHRMAEPFMVLHINVAVLGSVLLAWDALIRPIRERVRRSRRERGMEIATEAATPSVPAPEPQHVEPDHGLILQPVTIERPMPRITITGRRRFIRTAAFAAGGYATSAATLSAMDSTNEMRIERVAIKVPNLPEGLKGTTIAMIADIHSSVFMTRPDMERYSKELQALKPDMIFLVGDFINSKLREVYPLAEAFSGITAPLGVYGVTGNHDYYPKNIEAVAKEISQAGIRLLRNENLTIEKNGHRLSLLGIDDAHLYDINPYIAEGKTPQGTIENMVKGVPDDAVKLFLCHRPYPFEEYSHLGIDVMFSGHTHGGQVVLAHLDNLNLSFASLASRYVAGLYRARHNRTSQLYVTRGIGTVGIPLRLNCPPEVTFIVLV